MNLRPSKNSVQLFTRLTIKEDHTTSLSTGNSTMERPNNSYPGTRMRRMRKNTFSRALMRENQLSPADLIQPVFVIEGENSTESISST